MDGASFSQLITASWHKNVKQRCCREDIIRALTKTDGIIYYYNNAGCPEHQKQRFLNEEREGSSCSQSDNVYCIKNLK